MFFLIRIYPYEFSIGGENVQGTILTRFKKGEKNVMAGNAVKDIFGKEFHLFEKENE